MSRLFALLMCCAAVIVASPGGAQSVDPAGPAITWEVQNRFRLFREARDFTLHADALRGRSILESESLLAAQSEGRGWARNIAGRLCIDLAGRIADSCNRDGIAENYLAPEDHAVAVRLSGPVAPGAMCAWVFNDGETSTQTTLECTQSVHLRLRYGRPTVTTVDITTGIEPTRRAITEILVRDILIAGLGDSIASGEGNPDRAIELSNSGFCFRHFLGTTASQYFRPGRAGYKGSSACDNVSEVQPGRLLAWQQRSANWFNAACHRSLFSYQMRAAIALAVRDPHLAVTYLPLACSGATIAQGILGPQQASECLITPRGVQCQGSVPAQLASLRDALTRARKRLPNREIDMILLSIGANDIGFSGLVADVIVEAATERALFRRTGAIVNVEEARAALRRDLPGQFAALREALKSFVPDLSQIVYVSYANPALSGDGPCPGGRDGFDVHPAFHVNEDRIGGIVRFVQTEFLPRLKELARCDGGVLCREEARERMTFIDAHQAAFAQHGFCARAASDPVFDRECFSASGDSFEPDPVKGALKPMVCDRKPSDFRAYAPRARWVRTANDSYFAAMTYPQGLSSVIQPNDIHDAYWGVLSAVYGGAIHPTAQGHAAMADAALAGMMAVLARGPAGTDQ